MWRSRVEKKVPMADCSSEQGVRRQRFDTCSSDKFGWAPIVGFLLINSLTTTPRRMVTKKFLSNSYPRIIESAWLVFAGRIDFFTIAVRPNVPAMENNISFSINWERFKYPSCSSSWIFWSGIISPFTKFSTLTKFTTPIPDLSRGVVPLVIKVEHSPNFRSSQAGVFFTLFYSGWGWQFIHSIATRKCFLLVSENDEKDQEKSWP